VSTPSLARRGSVLLPLAFIGCGIVSLLAAGILLIRKPDLLATYHYNQYIVSVTHLFVLGWICSVVFGALYQLVPVALEVQLFSERLARAHLVFHGIGVAGMVFMFWRWNMLAAGLYGILVATGVALFVYNLSRTLARIHRWNVIAIGVGSGLFWLANTIAAGLFIVASKQWGIGVFDPIRQMHAHAHLGVLGFLIILIVSVSYKLIPMFLLGELKHPRRALASVWILNVATFGAGLSILFGTATKMLFAGVAILGIAFYARELVEIVRARKRRVLDWGVKYFLTGVAFLIPVSGLAVVLSWPGLALNTFTGQMENLYGLLALGGVVTLTLLGMLYKIVPFLVWYSRYSTDIGRTKVPPLSDLYSARLQLVGYWMFLAGLILLCVATQLGHSHCVQIAAGIWFGSLALFGLNVGKIVLHLVRPRSTAMPIPAIVGGVP
jgi:hypothetical protein